MEGDAVVEFWAKFGNNRVAMAAQNFEKQFFWQEPDEYFS